MSASTSIEQNHSSRACSDCVDIYYSWRSLHWHNIYTKFLWKLIISKVARWYHMHIYQYNTMVIWLTYVPFLFDKIEHPFSYTGYCCQNLSFSDVIVRLMIGILCSLICLPSSWLRMWPARRQNIKNTWSCTNLCDPGLRSIMLNVSSAVLSAQHLLQ